MTNFIGLTKRDMHKVMVNADHILYFAPDYERADTTQIALVGGDFLHVHESVYDIVERVEPEPDYYTDADANAE